MAPPPAAHEFGALPVSLPTRLDQLVDPTMGEGILVSAVAANGEHPTSQLATPCLTAPSSTLATNFESTAVLLLGAFILNEETKPKTSQMQSKKMGQKG